MTPEPRRAGARAARKINRGGDNKLPEGSWPKSPGALSFETAAPAKQPDGPPGGPHWRLGKAVRSECRRRRDRPSRNKKGRSPGLRFFSEKRPAVLTPVPNPDWSRTNNESPGTTRPPAR